MIRSLYCRTPFDDAREPRVETPVEHTGGAAIGRRADKTSSWLATLGEQRTQIALQLEDSPSLQLRFTEYVDKTYPSAVKRAALETGLDSRAFPPSNPYTVSAMMDLDFIP